MPPLFSRKMDETEERFVERLIDDLERLIIQEGPDTIGVYRGTDNGCWWSNTSRELLR